MHSKNIKILNLAHQVAKNVPGTKIDILHMEFDDLRNYRVSSQKAKKTRRA